MTFQATVINGLIHLPHDVSLPENSKVYVVVPASSKEPPRSIRSPRLANSQQAADFQMVVKGVADAGL